jgi:Fuc2NAc and GlcNAc transferase
MAIVLTFLGSLLVLPGTGAIAANVLAALIGSGIIVALVGFLDDHRPIPATLRLLTHFVAASWALFCLAGAPELVIAGIILPGWLANLVAAVYAVWLINLYNFMDGIDGIASIEAVTVSLGGAVLYWLVLPEGHWLVPALLLASAIGFLVWNFPPARIFMGDSGSGFLGITFAVVSLQAASLEKGLFWAWIILLGVFVADATITLTRRGLKGEKLYQAHRCHAYQHAARRLGSHRAVSLVVGVINLVWLLPIAALVVLGLLSAALGILMAYLPLIILCLAYRAGVHKSED